MNASDAAHPHRFVPFVTWLSAVGVDIWGVIKGLIEIKRTREERKQKRLQEERQLRWNKASLAREIIKDLFNDSISFNAMQILDRSGGRYEIAEDEWASVTHKELESALRVSGQDFSTKEKYIQDCFDELFDCLDLIEHYLRTDLILFVEVYFPLSYYGNRRKHFSRFIKKKLA